MDNNHTHFIAEVSSNHSRNLERCLAFVDAAADAGCDAVKFQLFRVEKLFAHEILARSKKHRERKFWELPAEFISPIAARCNEKNIDFCCTPFDLDAVRLLAPYVKCYKIASYELLWKPLLRACAATGKPIILSTGMANIDECREAVKTVVEAGCKDITLLHCVSHYPALPEEANLGCLRTLQTTCSCRVGWSDHTVNPGVILNAVFGYGASVVEFHLDLDGRGAEFSAGHCWLPAEIARVIQATRDGESARGNGIKTFSPSETDERLWRADPEDGLRPFKEVRSHFKGENM